MTNYKTARIRRQAPTRKPESGWLLRVRALIGGMLLLGFANAAPGLQALALGISEPSSLSRLFQPLRVDVPLELDGLPPEDVRVSLALDAISADGGSRPVVNTSLQREIVVDPAGRALLRVTSADLVREPALLLHVALSGGGIQVRRDLTLLFDPATQALASRPPALAPKPIALAGGAEEAALLREAERVSDYGRPAKKAAAAKLVAAAPAGHQAIVPGRAPGGLRLASRLSPPGAKLPAAAPPVVRSVAKLRTTDGLGAGSLELLRAVPARPVAAPAGTSAVPPVLPPPPIVAPPPVATPAPAAAAPVAVQPPPQAPVEAAIAPLPATPAAAEPVVIVPATVPETPPEVADGRSGGQPLGLLLGLLVAGVLTFGWLFRTVRATDASRQLPEPPVFDDNLGLRNRGGVPIEPRITPLELGRNAPEAPPPRPAATRGTPPVEPAPRLPESSEPVAKPVPKALESWSPDDFDLLTPIDDKRPGRR